MTIPNWVKKHRKPKQEIKQIGGRYYVYAVSSVWDAERKVTKKVSGKLIGRITKDKGFETREEYSSQSINLRTPIQTKEYGVTTLVTQMMKDSIQHLREVFPDEYERIVATAYGRLLHQSPLKNIGLHYEHSFLSEIYPGCSVGSKVIGQTIQTLGTNRDKIREYFRRARPLSGSKESILIDGTHILNQSKARMSEIGYNSQGSYSPQVNLVFIFAKNSNEPIYYRLVPGNIREVKSFKIALKESGLKNAVVIADKGFYSNSNIKELEDSGLNYIIPLQRSSSLIDYELVMPLDRRRMTGYFIFETRTIWYHCQGNVTLFVDEELRLREERDYLKRIETHAEDYSIDKFHAKSHTFGTISILSNLGDAKPQDIYYQYKSRGAIEQAFDSFKNLLVADRTYMRNDAGLEGWFFINHIALTWYYRIYSALLAAGLLSKFSVNDILARAAKIQKININNSWITSEVTNKTQKLLVDIGCPVT